MAGASGCRSDDPPGRVPRARSALASSAPKPASSPAYTVSGSGGSPATGPGERFNYCERIWCLTHRENFFVEHYLHDHRGWILHDELRGDVFVPRYRTEGPAFPDARPSVLFLCGRHVHPFIVGKGGGPIRLTGFNRTLGYDRAHFHSYGTRLDPCCINGAGSAFIHSRAGRQFRFHELDEFRAHPEQGWQKPFQARLEGSAH